MARVGESGGGYEFGAGSILAASTALAGRRKGGWIVVLPLHPQQSAR